jgi:mRNA-degrading endonuclease YafQ of YafQ-DinJ toxin-antitoxin module
LTTRNLISGTQFQRDVKLAKRRGKDMSKLRELISLLADGNPLPAHYKTTRSLENGSTTATVTWNLIGC